MAGRQVRYILPGRCSYPHNGPGSQAAHRTWVERTVRQLKDRHARLLHGPLSLQLGLRFAGVSRGSVGAHVQTILEVATGVLFEDPTQVKRLAVAVIECALENEIDILLESLSWAD